MDLLKILNDPNYINANQATKQAIFNKWAPLDPNYTSANEVTKNAIRQRFGLSSNMGNNLITKEEFISKIRSKYPVYNNIDDETLFNKIIAKYPVYKNQIVGFNNHQPKVKNPIVKQQEQTTFNKLINMNEDLNRLYSALQNAHNAGDTIADKIFAQMEKD